MKFAQLSTLVLFLGYTDAMKLHLDSSDKYTVAKVEGTPMLASIDSNLILED